MVKKKRDVFKTKMKSSLLYLDLLKNNNHVNLILQLDA